MMSPNFLPRKNLIQGAKALLASRSFTRSAVSRFSDSALQQDDDDLFASYSAQDEVDDANNRYTNQLQIRQTSDCGWGVLAAKSFTKGEKILTTNALATIPRDTHTLQKDWDKHVMIDAPGRLINHSCNGNIGVQDNNVGAYDFFALREIPKGEELFWDYETTEHEIKGFDKCICGDAKCRGSIGGFKKHGDKIKAQYGKYYASYLQKQD